MKNETRSFYELAVRQAIERILAGLDEALDLADLARGAALSPLHFHHVFRGLVGETPLEMHRRLRLERAASRLTDGTEPVTAIAFDAGYETHESFTRAFRQAYAASPSELRARARETRGDCSRTRPIELAARSGIHFADGHRGPIVLSSITGESTMDVRIETLPALRIAAVRHIGPYSTISDAFARLGQIAGPSGLFGPAAPPAAPMMLGIYHDDPESTPAAELRSDAGLVVADGVTLPAGLTEVRIPAGRYAMTTHIGPYALLGDVWAQLMGQWIPKSGHRIAPGVSYEVYRNNPMTAKPEALHTDIYVPVA